MTNTMNYLNKEVLAQKVYEYLSDNNVLFEDVCDGWTIELYNFDLHHEVFNTDYFYIYTSDAIEALEDYGTFQAIGEIVEYEKDRFGETSTDVSNPCNVANMLVYILGEKVIMKVERELYNWYEGLEDEIQEDEKQLQELFEEFCKNKA